MKTINDLISNLRTTLKSHNDDTDHSDQYLYEEFKKFRAVLLNRKSKKYEAVSQFNYQSFCIELETYNIDDCVSCMKDLSCCVMRSKKPLPTVISNRNSLLLNIFTFAGKEVSRVMDYSEYDSWQYTKTKKGKYGYLIDNGYLVLIGNDLLKWLKGYGALEDPTDLADYNTCGSDNSESCYDIRNDNFPVEDSLVPVIEDMILQKLLKTFNIEEDTKNDSAQTKPNQI